MQPRNSIRNFRRVSKSVIAFSRLVLNAFQRSFSPRAPYPARRTLQTQYLELHLKVLGLPRLLLEAFARASWFASTND